MAYSIDFRKKVLSYCERTGSITEASHVFQISRNTIYGWLKLKEKTGELNHQVKGTKPRKVDRDRLKNYLTDNPDAYLTEIASEFGCHPTTIHYALKALSQAYPDDYLLFVMDNAIWHKSSTLKIPTNIGFAFIPPYTPEMNPIEQVWKEIRKRGFKNKAFRTLEDVMNQLQDVIQGLEKEVIKSIVNRRWTRMLFESR
ncbi:transposase family protein [Streptococcus pneumoniae]|nr:transposase family protein [Streptococcus pneumoniae]